MQIKQASKYLYERNHFAEKEIKHEVIGGQCFNNVKSFCSTYQMLGRNVRVSLTIGMRGWDSGECTYGYHYLVKDVDTEEYSDPQYARYTFVELHSWTLEEYLKECRIFKEEYEDDPAEEFAFYYVEKYKKQLRAAMLLIKTQGWCKLSVKTINEYVSTFPEQLVLQPRYGQQEIKLLDIH